MNGVNKKIVSQCLVVILFSALILFVLYLVVQSDSSEKLYITEICTKNTTTAYDDNGRYGADYIEIYNASNSKMNLNGYGISDSLKAGYEFGNVYIEPQGTIVLWCNEELDDISLYKKDYIVRDIHGLDFGIKEDEVIYLRDRWGRVIEKVILPSKIQEGMVYACSLEDMEHFTISEPSVYSVCEKIEPLDEVMKIIDSPVISMDSGFYDEKIYVEMWAADGEIYYTLDGSEPTSDSIKYEGGFYIDNRSSEPNVYSAIGNISLEEGYLPSEPVVKGTTVKAIAINSEGESQVENKTYFVGIGNQDFLKDVAVMELTVRPDDLFGYEQGIYQTGKVADQYLAKYDEENIDGTYKYLFTNYAMEGKGWERQAVIDYYGSDHQKLLTQKVGIRIHGGWSTAYNQKGFNLYAREEYDGRDTFAYDFLGRKYGKIMLRSGGFRDLYRTKMRDLLNQSLVEDRSVGIQIGEPCVLFINGEYWGLYNLQETIGDDYIYEHYGVEDAIILKNDEANTSSEDVESFQEMVDFAENNDLSIMDNYNKLEKKMDMQSFIDYYAFQIYVANCDIIANNHARWRSDKKDDSKYGDGRWRWLLYDTDDSAGMVGERTDYNTDSFLEGQWKENPLGDNGEPLFSGLMGNPEFKERFVISFMDMANYNFDYGKVKTKLDQLAAIYREPTIASNTRFKGENYTEEKFDKSLTKLDEFYANRFEYITEYMRVDLGLSGELKELKIALNKADAAVISVNTIASVPSGWSGKYYSDYPVTLRCEALDGYSFVGWIDEDGNVLSTDSELELELTEDITVTAVVK